MLVGLADQDDAGVVYLNERQALVQTADFITPPVDDPYLFGKVAAANALSDIYAMGAEPLCALNLVSFPEGVLPQAVLKDILRGSLEQLNNAGAWLVGGHSVQDQEPKFGLAVSGLVDPKCIWRNRGACPADALLLTKPLGSGILLNAARSKQISPLELKPCLDSMQTLNSSAAEVLKKFTVHACTDVSGFGLAAHALEMARASKVCFQLSLATIPLFPHTLTAMEKGITTKATNSNKQFVSPHLQWNTKPPQPLSEILFDPQTSGGLLAAIPQPEISSALKELKKVDVLASQIGTVTPLSNKDAIYLLGGP